MNEKLRKKVPSLMENKKQPRSQVQQQQTSIPLKVWANQRFVGKVTVYGTHDTALWQTARNVVVSLLKARTGKKSIHKVQLFALNVVETIRCNLNDFHKAVRTVLQALYGLIPQPI